MSGFADLALAQQNEPRCGNHTHTPPPFNPYTLSGAAKATGFSTVAPIYLNSSGTGSPSSVSNSSIAGALGFSVTSAILSTAPQGYYTPSSGSGAAPFPTANISSVASSIPLSTGGSSGRVAGPLSTGGSPSVVSASPLFLNSTTIGSTGSTAGAVGATGSSAKPKTTTKPIGTAISSPFLPLSTGVPSGSTVGPLSTGGGSLVSASPFFPNSSYTAGPTGSTAGATGATASSVTTEKITKSSSSASFYSSALLLPLSTAGSSGSVSGPLSTGSGASVVSASPFYPNSSVVSPTGSSVSVGTVIPTVTAPVFPTSPASTAGALSFSSSGSANSTSTPISYGLYPTAASTASGGGPIESSNGTITSLCPSSTESPLFLNTTSTPAPSISSVGGALGFNNTTTSTSSSSGISGASASSKISYNSTSVAGASGASASTGLAYYSSSPSSLPTPSPSSTAGANSASPSPSFNLTSTAASSTSTAGTVGPSSSFSVTSNSSSSIAGATGATGASSTSSILTTFHTSTTPTSKFTPASYTKSEPSEYFWHHRKPHKPEGVSCCPHLYY